MTYSKKKPAPEYPVATLGERIKSTRRHWQWSQERLAMALHCNQASISYWESDHFPPSGTALVALAALFGCSVSALETGEGFVIPAVLNKLPVFAGAASD